MTSNQNLLGEKTYRWHRCNLMYNTRLRTRGQTAGSKQQDIITSSFGLANIMV